MLHEFFSHYYAIYRYLLNETSWKWSHDWRLWRRTDYSSYFLFSNNYFYLQWDLNFDEQSLRGSGISWTWHNFIKRTSDRFILFCVDFPFLIFFKNLIDLYWNRTINCHLCLKLRQSCHLFNDFQTLLWNHKGVLTSSANFWYFSLLVFRCVSFLPCFCLFLICLS